MSSERQVMMAQPAVEIIRVVNFPLERVWQAWVDPQKFARWWPGEGFEATDISADLRPGGEFRWGLRRLETGDTYMASGQYREIVERERFVISWDSMHNDDIYQQGAQVTISFRAVNDNATEVRILHEFLEGAQQCSDYSLGWTAAFDNLAQFLGEVADTTGLLGEPTRSLQMSVEIARPAAQIWQMLSEASLLTGWFPQEAELDARPGGRYCFRWHKPDGNCHERSGTVTAAQAPLKLDMEWFPTTWDPQAGTQQQWLEASRTLVSWRINESAGNTTVSLTHRGWQYGGEWDSMFKGHADGWQMYITNLREVMEGRTDIRS